VDLDELRSYCLSFPQATENLQWGDHLCFKVGGKLFAIAGLSSVPQSITVKCDPESFAELTEREGIAPAAYVGRYKWVTLACLDALSDSELREALSNSYKLVAVKAKPAGKHITRRKRKLKAA
jgi:predicted DNA-binding protein (MmcQ/YjbR family)